MEPSWVEWRATSEGAADEGRMQRVSFRERRREVELLVRERIPIPHREFLLVAVQRDSKERRFSVGGVRPHPGRETCIGRAAAAPAHVGVAVE